MLLELNKDLYNGLIPVSRIDSGTVPLREVYKGRDSVAGTDVMIIVYDRSVSGLDGNGEVAEFKLRSSLHCDVFPKLMQHGKITRDGQNLEFMVLPWLDCKSLREYVEAEGVLRWDVALPLFHRVLHGVHEIATVTGGGHYDLNPDNIYLTHDNICMTHTHDGGLNPVLCSLVKAGAETDSGEAAPVDGENAFYRAPENYEGAYSGRSDVFSLAMLLLYMLQGDYPFKERFDCAGLSVVDFEAKYVDMLSTKVPRIDILGSFKSVISRCLSVAPAMRPESVAALASHVGAVIEREGMKPYTPLEYVTGNNGEDDNRSEEPEPEPVGKPERRNDDDDSRTDPRSTRRRDDDRKANVEIVRVSGNGFKDVAGMEELKTKFNRNFISIVRNPDLAKKFLIAPPNGILLWGPPGNGKTFISRKLAEESGLLYTLVNPSDLGSIYVHGTQGMIGDLFARCEKMAAKEKTGVLLCLEEFDTLVPNRASQGPNNRNDEVAEFLTRLNNCAEKGVYVIATTNRIDAIDPAVMRKGRMDEVYYVGLPDARVRSELFQLEVDKRPHDSIDYNRLAEMTEGYTSGDISFLVKEAARKSFEATLAQQSGEPLGIAQSLLEATIKEYPSSVTSTERHNYEKLRDSYVHNRQATVPVGFKKYSDNK